MYIMQITEIVKKIALILLCVQIIISLVHIIKAKEKAKTLICSYLLFAFSAGTVMSTNMAGGLIIEGSSGEERMYVDLIIAALGLIITIFGIGIHLFFIRKNSKSDKKTCQNTKKEDKKDIDFKNIY